MNLQSLTKKYPLNTSFLKIVALITMFIDHLGASVILKIYGYDSFIYSLSRSIGRIAFPIFAFFAIEGFKKTSDRKNYFRRLFIFALITEIPFDLFNNQQFFYWRYQNVIFTILIGVLMLQAIEFEIYKYNNKIYEFLIVVVFCIIVTFIQSDYSFLGTFAIYMYYKAGDDRLNRLINGEIAFLFEFLSFVHLANILIYLYNGKRGNLNKYIFYVFYPLHLLVLYFIANYII